MGQIERGLRLSIFGATFPGSGHPGRESARWRYPKPVLAQRESRCRVGGVILSSVRRQTTPARATRPGSKTDNTEKQHGRAHHSDQVLAFRREPRLGPIPAVGPDTGRSDPLEPSIGVARMCPHGPADAQSAPARPERQCARATMDGVQVGVPGGVREVHGPTPGTATWGARLRRATWGTWGRAGWSECVRRPRLRGGLDPHCPRHRAAPAALPHVARR